MLREIASGVKTQIGNTVLNRENMTDLCLAAFFAGGHILLDGPTGLGKTIWAEALAQALGLTFKYERFIPDDPTEPAFAQVYMAKELADAPPKIINTMTKAMEDPHELLFIIATMEEEQNLHPSLNDRFMLSLPIPYPGITAEKQLLQIHHETKPDNDPSFPVCNPEAISQAKAEAASIMVEEPIFNYIISITETTRRVSAVATGASPRGSIALLKAAKAYGAIQGRDYATTDDVRTMALPVLRHRLKLKPDAIKEGVQPDQIIEGILAGRKTP
ncbi:MAG: MoxR family ATPase [Defluviitaleaceae bacterium]|nr:MoxR family ATPase [Defluviitaleaceae bacterium]